MKTLNKVQNTCQNPSQRIYSNLPTPIQVNKLALILRDYPNKHFLISGFTNGFSLMYDGPPLQYEIPNNKSAKENETLVLEKINKEIHLGRIAGPFIAPPLPDFRVSPLGLIPKKEPGSFRLIHDLSQPQLESVNSYIEDANATVKYETLDCIVDLLCKFGTGALMAKCDILEAFRIIPIRQQDHNLLGMKLGDKYYYDKVLPMGCRISCNLFEKFSTAMQWAVKNIYKFTNMSHILDDFIFVGPPDSFECMRGLQSFIQLAKFVGIPLKQEKTVLPTTCAIVHGIEIDTLTMTARIPKDKIIKAQALITNIKESSWVKLREVQKITGLLNFCCKCIRPGRAFLRRMWDLTSVSDNIQRKNHLVKLTACAKQDLNAWLIFLTQFNGVCLISNSVFPQATLDLYTDASKTVGHGAVLGTQWFYGTWGTSLKQYNIVILELIPIVIALHVFANRLRNQYLTIHTDNMALVYIINNQTSKCRQTMHLVRKLVLQALKLNVFIHAKHVRSLDNTLCDLLSRFKLKEAKEIAPQLDNLPVQIPAELAPCLLLQPL